MTRSRASCGKPGMTMCSTEKVRSASWTCTVSPSGEKGARIELACETLWPLAWTRVALRAALLCVFRAMPHSWRIHVPTCLSAGVLYKSPVQ